MLTTTAAHLLPAGSTIPVIVTGVGGNTGANNTVPIPQWLATVSDASHLILTGSVANAAYTSGGTVSTGPLQITDATNAAPIVLAVVHGLPISAQQVLVTVAGVTGNTAANGDWLATIPDTTHMVLVNSTGNGTYTANTGTASFRPNTMRGILNVPSVTGAPAGESMIVEGVAVHEGSISSVVSQGNAPIIAQSQTVDSTFHARPYVLSAAGSQAGSKLTGSGGCKIVTGSGVMTGGTLTVTLTGDAIFHDSTSYTLVATDITNATAVKAVQTDGSHFNMVGTSGESVNWIAVGW